MAFALLVKEFEGERIPMRGGYWEPLAYGQDETIQTVPVKCEYLKAFDIAILDPDSIKHFTTREEYVSRGWKNDHFWDQPVCAALELKYWKLGDPKRVCAKSVECDMEKLRAYQEERNDGSFLGIAMVFLQSASSDGSEFCGDGIEVKSDPHEGIAKYVIPARGPCHKLLYG